MNNKIINTFRHGDAKTKTVLAVMLAGLAVGAVLLIVSVVAGVPTLTFISIVLLILDAAYIIGTDFNKEAIEREKKEKLRAAKKARREQEKRERKENGDDEPGALEWISSDKPDKKKNGEENPDENGIDLKDPKKEQKEKEQKDKGRLAKYDEAAVNKVLVQYKVRQEHVMILIDSCVREKIKETAGFLWKDKTYAYILLLEEEPRMIKFPIYDFPELKVRQGVSSRPSEEYDDFKNDSYVARLFTPLLPNYSSGEDPRTRRSVYRKNLYGIGPDIWCTSRSVKNILNVLSLNVILTDSRLNSDTYGKYFRDVYTSRLLFRDAIFSAAEYKDEVLTILTDLARNSDNDGEFVENISQLQMNGLIPQEYVDYATQKRKFYREAAKQNKKKRK